jgi:hypothetical protein
MEGDKLSMTKKERNIGIMVLNNIEANGRQELSLAS